MNFKDYNPTLLFKLGHLNTMYPTLFRDVGPIPYVRTLIPTPDHDELHIDVLQKKYKRMAILCHGLEGSSSSTYIQGLSQYLHHKKWDIAAVNYRTCGGIMNKTAKLYHGGATYDVDTIVDYFKDDYDEIALIGFSLGGNLSLVYVGDKGENLDPRIKALVAISVPTNLIATSKEIAKKSNFIYQRRFLKSLKEKVKIKAQDYPDIYNVSLLKEIKTLYDFDDVFTGPIGGFKNALDYYTQCRSDKRIPLLKIPTLIINAKDDPFLPIESYPYTQVEKNKNVQMLTPKYGGHVGFVQKNKKHYWSEKTIGDYLEEHIPFHS